MSWTCPICKKEFRNRNQEHFCTRVPIDVHFVNKPVKTGMINNRLMQEVRQLGRSRLIRLRRSFRSRPAGNRVSVGARNKQISDNRIIQDIEKPSAKLCGIGEL